MTEKDKEDRRKYKGPKFNYDKFWKPFKSYREILNESRKKMWEMEKKKK